MNKKILLMFTFLFAFFIFKDNVLAEITTKNTEIECIYANGVSIGLSYDETSDQLSTYVKDYPISKSVVIDGPALSDMYLFNCDGTCPNENVDTLSLLTCPSEVRVWKIFEQHKDEDGDWQKTTRAVYSFKYYYNNNPSDTITNYYGGLDGKDDSTGWWIFGKSATNKTKVLPLTSNSPLTVSSDTPEERIPLVGERIYIVGELADSDYSVAFKSASNEAVGSNTYVQFLKKGSTYYAKRGKTITSISAGEAGIITGGANYICFKESVASQDASRSDSSYKFNSVRHQVQAATIHQATKDKEEYATCPSGFVSYKLDDKVCKIDGNKNGKSFCDEFSNTAKVLIKIIQWMQILVPALTIVLTAVDIGRIVVAGDIEEKMPKMKKNIVIRLIVACIFFFLPIITRLIIAGINDKEIYEVDCLFNDGISSGSNNNENCVDI